MPRTKGGIVTRRRHKKWLKLAAGYRGSRSRKFKIAKLAVIHALSYAYIGRKKLKRNMRQLWNTRIGIAAHNNGLSYSKFIHGLKVNNIELDRKILSAISTEDTNTFEYLVDIAKKI